MTMTRMVMMIIGGIVVIVASSGCLIPSANYGGDSTKWHRHFTLTAVMMMMVMIEIMITVMMIKMRTITAVKKWIHV